MAHKVVWLHTGLNLDSLVRRQELNSLLFLNSSNPQPTLPVRVVTYIPWSQFLSAIFILTSLNDTSSPRAWTPALMLHLINPCTMWKVLILTKPKGKIYKTKSLRHYITKALEMINNNTEGSNKHLGCTWGFRKNIISLSYNLTNSLSNITLTAGAVEYTDCIYAEG